MSAGVEPEAEGPVEPSPLRRVVLAVSGLLVLGLSLLGALWPGIELVRALLDPNLQVSAPAAQVWRWHHSLSPAFAEWAQERRQSDAASGLSLSNISGTEWPLFGSVFYLRATENLERAWRLEPEGEQPSLYARAAIDAAAELVADPRQAAWVQKYWVAEQYLRRENVFYRMLLIDALATHARLTGSGRWHPVLSAQVASLAAELSASPTGLLADYPEQTFPADVAAAWHAIQRADAVLQSDHRAQIAAGLRGLTGAQSAPSGLPPYAWYGEGEATEATEVRGCANAWLLHHAPYLWPEQAVVWSARNVAQFWQRGFWLSGFREFARDQGPDHLYSDVDSGPVIAGLGTSASAFGIGAYRTLGQFQYAWPLSLELIALSWPLPNGRLLAPRLASDPADAPLLGEAAILYNLSQATAPGFASEASTQPWRDVPGIVWVMLGAFWTGGGLVAWWGFRMLRRAVVDLL